MEARLRQNFHRSGLAIGNPQKQLADTIDASSSSATGLSNQMGEEGRENWVLVADQLDSEANLNLLKIKTYLQLS